MKFFETSNHILIEMEYLRGAQLKRVFEMRLDWARSVYEPKKANQTIVHQDSGSESDDPEIPKKFELLELGSRLKITAALFSEEQVASVIRGVLSGLLPLHEMDYIHRDVKPENIVLACSQTDTLTGEGLKLVDFGFSAKYRLRKWEQLSGGVGTTLFMAPE